MNDNDIVKAFDILDKFEFFGGQRAGRLLWFNKPADIQEKDIGGFNRDIDFLKAFINRQRAEIERLTGYNENLRAANSDITNKLWDEVEEAKTEAIKEFAERLKETPMRFRVDHTIDCFKMPVSKMVLFIDDNDIDNLVKEMTEGEDETS